MANITGRNTNKKSDVYMHLDELLKNASSCQKNQTSKGEALIYKAKMAKMNLILYLSKKQNNFMKLACYVDYKGYEEYETRDDWGKVTAKRGIPRDENDAKEKALMAAKAINNAIQKGFLTENDVKNSSFSYVLFRIQYIEPKLADWSAAVTNTPKENKNNSTRTNANSTAGVSKTTMKGNERK